jgi:integrase
MASKNLTRASVESLAYQVGGPHKQILWDAKLRGFGCRVTPQGGKQFVLLYRASGRQRLMSLGRVEDFVSLDSARTKAGGFLHGLRDGGLDPMAARERLADAQSMHELWTVYEREHIARQSENTRKAVTSTWSVHLAPVVGSLKPGQVTKADVIRVHDRATEHGKIVANRAVQRLRAMLTWLFDRNERQFPVGWRNPAFKPKLHKEAPRTSILDVKQQHALIAALIEEPCPWTRVYLQCLLLTGCRANELLSLKWSDVDYEKATALIARSSATTTTRKNGGSALLVPLPPVALTLLRSLPVVAGSEYVFPSPRKPSQPYTSNAIRRRYEAALDRARLPHRTLHDLRRSMGTNIARTGASTKQIAQLLGNTDEVTARVYVQLVVDDLRRLSDANATNLLPAPQS